jgi:thiol-disulfide isomerase/thioredoxin
MDRLSAVIIAAMLATPACDKDSPAPPPSRVEGASAGTRKAASTEAFCDVHTTSDNGPTLSYPPLAGAPVAAAQPGHWLWLNIWATWCKPCTDELPRLARWRDKLASAGRHVDLAFVSIDENEADVEAFRKEHPGGLPSARLVDPTGKQSAWFAAIGLDAGSPIPIHVFVSPAGHIRCARAGGVREQDYPAIERLLGE